MKTVASILSLLLLLLLASQASGSFWFQVINISPISLTPNSEANFTVAVKGLGSQGSYVALVFKNMSQGLNISCPKLIKYVLPAGITKYNCTIRAGDIAPGNYSFVVDVAAKGSPTGKKTAWVEVLAGRAAEAKEPQKEAIQNKTQKNDANQTSASPQTKATPAPGAALAALALLLAARRLRS
ncbi:Uncharacterised protein [uncultured archaeon]|nr:Uncharacterised protein [uncultured archaeon]